MTQWGIDTLFNPAKRHMDEEKRRLQSTRQQIGDNSGGKRIDLESGHVKIDKVDSAETDESAPKAKKSRRGTGEPSAAAKRAAARRGRTLD